MPCARSRQNDRHVGIDRNDNLGVADQVVEIEASRLCISTVPILGG